LHLKSNFETMNVYIVGSALNMETSLVHLNQLPKKQRNNQYRAIQREFEPIGPTLLKNPLGAGWGLICCLPCSGWAFGFLPT
jgi:hypothetical protein